LEKLIKRYRIRRDLKKRVEEITKQVEEWNMMERSIMDRSNRFFPIPRSPILEEEPEPHVNNIFDVKMEQKRAVPIVK
jgi:hypothetical protein